MALSGECVLFTGCKNENGYGRKRVGSRVLKAHVVAYEARFGAVPSGLELDHLCRNRACVNPDHLEPVTHAENCRRRSVLVTHCPAGHEYTPENTRHGKDGRRDCRTCNRDQTRARRAAARLPAKVGHTAN